MWAQVAKCVEIGLPEIILLLIFSQVHASFHYAFTAIVAFSYGHVLKLSCL
jgi:hypothetical protein